MVVEHVERRVVCWCGGLETHRLGARAADAGRTGQPCGPTSITSPAAASSPEVDTVTPADAA
jgi:hypothetical protein